MVGLCSKVQVWRDERSEDQDGMERELEFTSGGRR